MTSTNELGGARVIAYRSVLRVCMPASRAPAPIGTSTAACVFTPHRLQLRERPMTGLRLHGRASVNERQEEQS